MGKQVAACGVLLEVTGRLPAIASQLLLPRVTCVPCPPPRIGRQGSASLASRVPLPPFMSQGPHLSSPPAVLFPKEWKLAPALKGMAVAACSQDG